MPKRWIDSCYAVVVVPTMATSMLPGCTHLLFPLLHAEKFPFSTFLRATKKIADIMICMHAGLEDVTINILNKNCLPNLNVLNVKLMVSLCSTKFNLSTLADKLRIVFETSKLKIIWWQFFFLKNWSIRTENYLLLTARCICQLNGKKNGFTTK